MAETKIKSQKSKANSTSKEVNTKVAKSTAKKEAVKTSSLVKPTSLTTDVYGPTGSVTGSITLPETIFAAKINKQLMAQAVRVYLANQREGGAKTKTRGEVEGSTKKIFKQKGTGNARHGSITAPIFVGGGIVFGPTQRDYTLSLPPKMKQRAFVSSLTQKYTDGCVRILSGFTDVEKKTKVYANIVHTISPSKKTLVIISNSEKTSRTYMRNIEGVTILRAQDAYAYAVLIAGTVIISEAALAEFKTQ